MAKTLFVIGGLVFVAMFVLVVAAWRYYYGEDSSRAQVADVSGAKVEIYTARAPDSSIMGLAIEHKGERRTEYYPLQLCLSRSMSDCTVTVLVSEDTKELSVESSWEPGVLLAHYAFIQNVCTTGDGPQVPCEVPFPDLVNMSRGGYAPGIASDQKVRKVMVHIRDGGRRLEVE